MRYCEQYGPNCIQPIHVAAIHGRYDIFETLLWFRPHLIDAKTKTAAEVQTRDFDTTTHSGLTPLDYALRSPHTCEFLLRFIAALESDQRPRYLAFSAALSRHFYQPIRQHLDQNTDLLEVFGIRTDVYAASANRELLIERALGDRFLDVRAKEIVEKVITQHNKHNPIVKSLMMLIFKLREKTSRSSCVVY